MFYIVEQEEKLKYLENLVKLGCFVNVIPCDYNFHPKLTTTTAVYIRLLNSYHGFIIPINHEEGLNVDKKRVYKLLKNTSKLYTLNKKELLYHFSLPDAKDISLLYSMIEYDRLDIFHSNKTYNYFYSKILILKISINLYLYRNIMKNAKKILVK